MSWPGRCNWRKGATPRRGHGWRSTWVGKASASAPTALTVQVNQWSGKDPLTERLARPLIHQEQFPLAARDDALAAHIQDAIAAELVRKLPTPETAAKPAPARACGDSGDEAVTRLP